MAMLLDNMAMLRSNMAMLGYSMTTFLSNMVMLRSNVEMFLYSRAVLCLAFGCVNRPFQPTTRFASGTMSPKGEAF